MIVAGNQTNPTTWLSQHPEFIAIAKRIGRLSKCEHRDRLACGALAERCLKRYDRELNAARMAEYLSEINERRISRETLNDYRAAFRMYRAWREECGGQPPQLDITKLAQAWRSGKGHLTDADRVRLCERTYDRGLARSQMRMEALRLSKERSRAKLRYRLRPASQHVRLMDDLALIRECDPESIDVLILDWMYKPLFQSPKSPLPNVHTPDDTVGHIIKCIRAATRALTKYGIVAFFSDHRDDHNISILTALKSAGFRRRDQYISQRIAGGFSQAAGAIYANSHEPLDIYRRADVKEFPRRPRYSRSVSPKWHNRNHRASDERAVHPCEKPVELMKAIIEPVTVNGLIVDPFAGSGSSGVAAVQLGCQYRGAERIQHYVDIANQRIAVAADRVEETQNAINTALDGANPQEKAAIELYLENAGIELVVEEEAA